MKSCLQLLAIEGPPTLVELIGEDLKHYYLITIKVLRIVLPKTDSGSANEGSHPAKVFGQVCTNLFEEMCGKRVPVIVMER